jgi:hypothetical protein
VHIVISHLPSVFVIGSPRSGTSFTARLLGSCKSVLYWEESALVIALANGEYNNSKGIDRLLKFASLARRLKPYDYPDDVFNVFHFFLNRKLQADRELLRFRSLKGVSLVKTLLTHYSKNYNLKVFVEKTPTHAFHVDNIRKHFPNSKFLHVIRHPLDVVASFKEFSRFFGSNWSAVSAADFWNRHFAAAFIKSTHSIKYDDLISNEIIAKQLIVRLGLQWTEATTRTYRKDHKNNCLNWNDRLTPLEIEIAIKHIDWQQAEKVGYFRP